MASLEPPPLDFNDTFVNEEDSNDDLFLPTKSPCLNNLAQDKKEPDVSREENFVEDQVHYKPPSGFKQVDHASPVTSLDFHVEAPLDERSDDKIHVCVSDPRKMGENMSAYITYKVTTKTSMPTFTAREMEVHRRFSDFYALYERLLEKHSQEGRFVPLPPEKNILSMAKVKVTKDDASSSDFVERRRKLLERFLRRIANHPHLRNDPNFVDFLEADGSPIRPPTKGIMSGAGFLKFFQRMEDSFNKVTYKMEESDKWFEKKEAHLNIMEECLQSMCWCLESLIFHKKEFSQNLVVTSKSLACMSPVEEEGSLCKVLTQLSEVWEGVSCCHSEHLEEGCITLLEFIKECLGSILSAKETMMMRVKLHKIWKDNEVTLAKKREAKIRMELAYKTDKIAEANRDIAEWEQHVERSQEDFEKISHNIKDEMKRFDNLLVKDFKEALLSFLESTLSFQKKIIKNWETFLSETQ